MLPSQILHLVLLFFAPKCNLAHCPNFGVHHTDRGYPFQVAVTANPYVTGFIMVEQVKSIDYRARQAVLYPLIVPLIARGSG